MKLVEWDGRSPKCSNVRCRKHLDDGAGNQFVGDNDKLYRLCWDCWKKRNKEIEDSSERQAAKTVVKSAQENKGDDDGRQEAPKPEASGPKVHGPGGVKPEAGGVGGSSP